MFAIVGYAKIDTTNGTFVIHWTLEPKDILQSTV